MAPFAVSPQRGPPSRVLRFGGPRKPRATLASG
jgi:hypothetical protein